MEKGMLQETYGVIVYQEQVMQIAQVLAGFTLGGADLLRRAMGKKKAEEMAKQRAVFVEGAAKNDVDAEQADLEIFDLMEKFAGYGFNKSHSAAYALSHGYQTWPGWLKAHAPGRVHGSVATSTRRRLGDDYNTYESLLCSDEPLLVQGTLRVEKEEDRVNVSVRIGAGRPRRGEPEATGPFVTLLADVRSSRARAVEIGIASAAVSPERLSAIGALLREPRHAGQCDAFLRITTADGCDVKLSVPGVRIAPDDDLQDQIQRIFSGACTVSVV
jgi:hypothetical protein